MMSSRVTAALAAIALAALGACDTSRPVEETSEPLLAGATPLRPFKGTCDVTVAKRVHEDGSEGGNCGGEEHQDPGGGPPIQRHFDVTGSCQLTHLGLTQVSGRLNLVGPFGAEGHDPGHAALGARGRLQFTAANGDQLVGRYVPIDAGFTSQGDGGSVAFHSTQEYNESCEGGGGGGHGGSGGQEEEEEPVSTGRFTEAVGQATLTGNLRIFKSTGTGQGTITLDGSLQY